MSFPPLSLLQDFWTLTLGIVVEALPFVVLGILVSIFLELVIKREWLVRIVPKNRIASHLMLSLLGVLFPVCECGNVPVARGLMMKGFTPSQAASFLLAAPIINPVTFFTTSAAFGFAPSVVVIRMLGALAIANIVALVLSTWRNADDLLQHDFAALCHIESDQRKLTRALHIFEDEFWSILKLLCVGALIASAIQLFVPQQALTAVGHHPFWSIAAMMVIGLVVSVCSSVDAFLALAFIGDFTLGSILVFLLFGAMTDIRMISLLRATFSKQALVTITLLAAVLSAGIGIGVNLFLSQ